MVNVTKKTGTDGNMSVTFTFSIEEITRAGLRKEFVHTWSATRTRPYYDFIGKLMEAQRRERDPLEDMRNAFRQKFGQDAASYFQQEYLKGFNSARGKDRTYSYNGTNTRLDPDPAWCKTLGLPKTATKEEIKAKYRQLAKKHHPDAGGSAAKFNQIQEAYKEATR